MKLLITMFLGLTLSITPVFAAIPTPTKTASNSATKTNALDDLKERLATKVAQLRTSEKRAIFGVVKSITETTLVVETKTRDIKVELADEIKVVQYVKGKRTTLTISDIEKGDAVTVYGDYDTTLELLKATFILIQSAFPLRLSGTVATLDRKDYSLTLTASDSTTYTIDIETTTKVSRWDKTNKFTKSGFSKMIEGETIHVVGTAVPKKENRVSAIRILNLGNPVGDAPASPSATPTP